MRWFPVLAALFLASCRTAGPAGVRVETAVVRGGSMSPLLKDGDLLKISYGFYDTHEVQRGDLVVCRFAFRRDPIIKLVRAVPGDRFGLKELPDASALLLVNGAELENSAGKPYKFNVRRKRMLALYEKDYKGVIPANSYLLLGDLPEGSLDSGIFGLVDRSALIGKAAAKNMIW
jgi:signal peptidase I